MAKKVTVTLTDEQIAGIRERIATRPGRKVADYVKRAVEKQLENDSEFLKMVDEVLMKTGGPLKAKERASVDKILSRGRRGGKTRQAA